jgi:hypothetical protein
MTDETIQKLIGENFVFVICGGVALVAIVSGTIKSVVGSMARERSRREIAAYIAEKAMTPEEGERLMTAGRGKDRCC